MIRTEITVVVVSRYTVEEKISEAAAGQGQLSEPFAIALRQLEGQSHRYS
jgi:hypothetical protein